MISIPKQYTDLCRLSMRRTRLTLLFYAVWLVLWLVAALAYNQNRQTVPNALIIRGWRMVAWMAAAALIGFFLFRVHRLWTGRPCVGRIEQIKYVGTYAASTDPGASRQADYRTHQILRIRLPNGRLRKLRFEQKSGFYSYYYTGKQVVCFFNLPYPQVLDAPAEHGYVCAVCGEWQAERKETCPICKHSIIDPHDISL